MLASCACTELILTFNILTMCFKVTVAGSWILALVLQLREYGKQVVHNLCVYDWSKEFVNSFSLMWHSFVFISCVILALLYARVVHTLWFRRNSGNDVFYQQQVWRDSGVNCRFSCFLRFVSKILPVFYHKSRILIRRRTRGLSP